jgi:VWFA-related protein
MRKTLALLAVVIAMSVPSLAVKRMTVEQLKQTVAAAQASHRKDDEMVQQLAEVELTARLSSTALQQMIAASPGPGTTQLLRAIADTSAFLPPPPGEIPNIPAPTIAAQKAMLAHTIQYVSRTLPGLPDFLATRKTEHYDDSPHPTTPGGWPVRSGFQYRDHDEIPIAFQDGRETDDPAMQATRASAKKSDSKKEAIPPKAAPRGLGLESWGEFGPILGVVLVDAAKGKLSWARWEQLDGKPAAVFQFSVDRSASHYTVESWANASSDVIGNVYGSRRQGASSAQTFSGTPTMTRKATGYHGLLTVDPETGTVLRIVIEADLRPEDTIQRGAIMVEYGPVRIGEGIYTCPTHSVTISLSHALYQETKVSGLTDIVEMQLNDVSFTGYRRFGSQSTLLAVTDPAPAENPTASKPPQQTDAAAAAPPTTNQEQPAAAAPATEVASASPPTPPPAPAATVASASPPSSPSSNLTPDASDEEVLLHSVNGMPGMNDTPDKDAGKDNVRAGASQPASKTATDGAFTLQITTRLVDLGLVAIDKYGKPITDLKPEDIEIYDNGRKQQLRSFQHPGKAAPASSTEEPSADTFTNAVPTAVQAQSAPDLLILLIDESHLAFLDLNRARTEVLRFLKAAPPDSRIALYSIGEHGSHIIQDVTSDHALVATRLAAWMPVGSAVSHAQDLDLRNRQQIDTVHNPADLNSVNGNNTESPDYIQTPDPMLRQLGDNPLRNALESMIVLARHFASVPGNKSLVWISGDSALVDWEDRAVMIEKGDKTPNAALAHTREVLNEARIALYAVDASAVTPSGGGAVDASLANPTVQLNSTAAANSAPGGAGLPQGAAMGAGRTLADLQVNTRAIQTPVRQLAEATGGLAINKGSDLQETLDGIERHASALYEIGFYPDTTADNKYHTLQVKIPSRKDVKLRYRTGYLYAEQAATIKQRFQEAVWAPQDLTGISLTAEAVNAEDTPTGKNTVKLRIAFPGLSFKENNAEDAPRWTDQLYIFVAERADASQKATVDGDTLRLSLRKATYDSGMPAGIPYQHAVAAKDKLGSIRIIVVDGNSGRMGSITLPSSAFAKPS